MIRACTLLDKMEAFSAEKIRNQSANILNPGSSTDHKDEGLSKASESLVISNSWHLWRAHYVFSTLHISSHVILTTVHIIAQILHLRNVKFRDIKQLARCQSADQRPNLDSNRGLHDSTAQALTLRSCAVFCNPRLLLHYFLQLRVHSVLEVACLVGTACCRVIRIFYCQSNTKERYAYRWGICFLTI